MLIWLNCTFCSQLKEIETIVCESVEHKWIKNDLNEDTQSTQGKSGFRPKQSKLAQPFFFF